MLKKGGKGLAAIAIVVASFWITLYLLGPPASDGGNPNESAKTQSNVPVGPQEFDEKLYLAANPDVVAALSRGEFHSAYEHYRQAGFFEHRLGASVPGNWNEAEYLKVNPDVAAAVKAGTFMSGYHHWLVAGRREGRHGGPDQAAIK